MTPDYDYGAHTQILLFFRLLCSCYVTVMIKKLELHLLVFTGTPKLVCPKSVHRFRKQPVSTPGMFIGVALTLRKQH